MENSIRQNDEIGIEYVNKEEEEFLDSLCSDLAVSGWKTSKGENKIKLIRELAENQKTKENVRNVHKYYRDLQLKEPSVTSFLKRCNTITYFKNKRVSIKSLIADGPKLVERIESAAKPCDDYNSLPIKPYIQEASSAAKCEYTGYLLSDIWRYFRHTWSSEHRAIPGRKLNILIRDSTLEFHPVIGILGLTSPILNLGVRDEALGLSASNILKYLQAMPAQKALEYLQKVIEKSLIDIYLDDLYEDQIVSFNDIKNPSVEKIRFLESKANELSKTHSKLMGDTDSTFGESVDLSPADIKNSQKRHEACISPLFKGKRIKYLSQILKAQKVLKASASEISLFSSILGNPPNEFIRDVVSFVLLRAKNERLASSILDLSVCGAVAPYSHVLGGKLVSLLAGSPEIQELYSKNYASSPSIIASIMGNKLVYKDSTLIGITTTSLYSSGSSQYNRIKIPVTFSSIFNDGITESLEYRELGTSEGYGTFQFSGKTLSLANKLKSRESHEGASAVGTRANSIFGEGSSPRLRKIREIFERFKIPSDKVLNHSYKRIVYLYSLVQNISEEILKPDLNPRHILRQSPAKEISEEISLFWFNRWASNRVLNNIIVDKIQSESFTQTGMHNAYINTPTNNEN
jgi:hypothetical protein